MLLITPNEVVSLAFMGREAIDPLAIRAMKIDIAQQQYIRPRMGDMLFDEMESGMHSEFVSEYIKPALACYVRASIIDELSIQISDRGAIIYENSTSGTKEQSNDKSSNVGVVGNVDSEVNTTNFDDKDYTDVLRAETVTDGVTVDSAQTPVPTATMREIEEDCEVEENKTRTFSQINETINKKISETDENKTTTLTQNEGERQEYSSEVLRAATSEQRKVLVIRALDDAKVLIAKAVRYIERHQDEFPSYEQMNLSQRIFF